MKIYLCGFMGCGKSRIGRTLAKKLGMNFADLDKYIVAKEGMTIPEIFEKYGEPHFRALEAKYIAEMPEGSVVALGGGAIINDNTAEVAHANGKVVFLDARFEVCYGRIKDDKNRPLAYNNPEEKVRELFDARRPIYLKRSDIVIKPYGTPPAIAHRIADRVNGHHTNKPVHHGHGKHKAHNAHNAHNGKRYFRKPKTRRPGSATDNKREKKC